MDGSNLVLIVMPLAIPLVLAIGIARAFSPSGNWTGRRCRAPISG
jgi:hypothetical protein